MNTGADNQEQEQSSTFKKVTDWLLSQFSFSSMFTIGLILLAGYFLAKSEPGQKFINEMAEKYLSPEWQAKLEGIAQSLGLEGIGTGAMAKYLGNMPALEAREAMIKHGIDKSFATAATSRGDAAWKGLVEDLNKATGGLSKDSITSDKALYALLSTPRHAPMVQEILKTLPQGGAASSDMSKRIMVSMRTIVNNPAQFATLFNDENKANSFAALRAISPISFTGDALEKFVEKTAMDGGKPSPAFSTLLNQLLADNPATRIEGIGSFVKTADATAMHTLVHSIDLSKVDDKDLHRQLETLQVLATSPTNMKSAQELLTTLPPEKLTALLAVASDQDKLIQLLGKDEQTLAAMRSFAQTASIKELPDSWQKGLNFLRAASDTTIDAAEAIATTLQRHGISSGMITGAITANGTASPRVIAANTIGFLMNEQQRALVLGNNMPKQLGALAAEQAKTATTAAEREMYEFLGTKGNPDGKGERYVNIDAIGTFLDGIASNPANQGKNAARTNRLLSAIAGKGTLDQPDVAQFLQDPTNNALLNTLLTTLDLKSLPENTQPLVTALRTHMGALKKVLMEPDSGMMVTESFNEPRTGKSVEYDSILKHLVSNRDMWMCVPLFCDSTIRENSNALIDVVQALRKADVQATPQVAAQPPMSLSAPAPVAGNANAAAITPHTPTAARNS